MWHNPVVAPRSSRLGAVTTAVVMHDEPSADAAVLARRTQAEAFANILRQWKCCEGNHLTQPGCRCASVSCADNNAQGVCADVEMTEADQAVWLPAPVFIASYILALHALRCGSAAPWATGRRSQRDIGVPSSTGGATRMEPDNAQSQQGVVSAAATTKRGCHAATWRVRDVPGLTNVLQSNETVRRKLSRWFCATPSCSRKDSVEETSDWDAVALADVFSLLQLRGISTNITDVVALLLRDETYSRGVVLMHSIPSPMQVLRQQANGQRVVTAFLAVKELASLHVSPLNYMNGHHRHARDALDFLLHDLSHYELFRRRDIFEEQVGFFSAVAKLGGGRPKWYFTTGMVEALSSCRRRVEEDHQQTDEEPTMGASLSVADAEHDGRRCETVDCWDELEYCFSDMNCWVTHLMGYLKAKVMNRASAMGASRRVFDQWWADVLTDLGLADDHDSKDEDDTFTWRAGRVAAQELCRSALSVESSEALRCAFRRLGALQLTADCA